MTFDEAVNLIKSNGNVELLSAINFDVNFISRVSKSEFYHSGLYENIKEITHTKTLLHVAIQCNHLSVIYFLLKRGADPTIPLMTEYQHRQRPGAENIIREESKSSANDWKVIDSSHTVITCKELAYHNEEIRALLKGVEWDIVMADKEKRRLERFKGKTVKKMNPVKGSTVSMYGFSTQSAARIKEKKWQRRVTETFFKIGQPLQEGKQSYRIYHTLKEAIRSKSDHSVCINSFCRRSFIIALTHILSEYGHMPALCFRLGGENNSLLGATYFKFIPSSNGDRQRQRGSFIFQLVDCPDIQYGKKCLKRLKNILQNPEDNFVNKNNRKETLLKLFEERLEYLIPFTSCNFNEYGNININGEEYGCAIALSVKSSIDFLNGLLFLVTIVEVLLRLYRTREGAVYPYKSKSSQENDAFPVATAQARSLLLLLAGKITFEDFLGESSVYGTYSNLYQARFGCVTGKPTTHYFNLVLQKLLDLNDTYNNDLSCREVWKNFRTVYLQSNPSGYFIAGKSRLYYDLKKVYGSGNESENEGVDYSDSSDEEINHAIVFEP